MYIHKRCSQIGTGIDTTVRNSHTPTLFGALRIIHTIYKELWFYGGDKPISNDIPE